VPTGKGGQNGVVDIGTRYGLDGPEFETQGGVFSKPVHSGPGAQPASYTMGIGALYQEYIGRGVKTTHPLLPPRLKIGRVIPLLLS